MRGAHLVSEAGEVSVVFHRGETASGALQKECRNVAPYEELGNAGGPYQKAALRHFFVKTGRQAGEDRVLGRQK